MYSIPTLVRPKVITVSVTGRFILYCIGNLGRLLVWPVTVQGCSVMNTLLLLHTLVTLVNDVTHFCEYEICKAYILGGYVTYKRVIRISKYTFTSNTATNELPA